MEVEILECWTEPGDIFKAKCRVDGVEVEVVEWESHVLDAPNGKGLKTARQRKDYIAARAVDKLRERRQGAGPEVARVKALPDLAGKVAL